MNITRRAALGGATVLAFMPSARAARRAPTIHSKIEAHRAALEVADKAWGVCGEIETAMPKIRCRVQISKMLHGRGQDGAESFTPIYAYTSEEIDRHIKEWTGELLHFHGRHPEAEKSISRRMSDRSLRLHAELNALEQEERRFDDESGYTDALEDAERKAEVADNCLLAIHRHAFAELEELRAAASYLVESAREGQASCDREMLADFVEAIAGKVVAS